MLRFEVREVDGEPLPAIDLDDPVVVIGSAPDAKIRLPAAVARPEHVRVVAAEIGEGTTYEIGTYRVRVAPAPAGTVAARPQRTESLARELVRNLLGAGAQPALEVEHGPHAGARRALAAPDSLLVIGRGDEAGWILDDADLSRAHAEVRRGWDGAWLRDLGSKNGTRLDGTPVGGEPVELRDGARVELGTVVLRFRDPAERHLGGAPVTPAAVPAPARPAAPSAPVRTVADRHPAVFYAALCVLALALAGLGWLLRA